MAPILALLFLTLSLHATTPGVTTLYPPLAPKKFGELARIGMDSIFPAPPHEPAKLNSAFDYLYHQEALIEKWMELSTVLPKHLVAEKYMRLYWSSPKGESGRTSRPPKKIIRSGS